MVVASKIKDGRQEGRRYWEDRSVQEAEGFMRWWEGRNRGSSAPYPALSLSLSLAVRV